MAYMVVEPAEIEEDMMRLAMLATEEAIASRSELTSRSFCKSSVAFFAEASVCFQFRSPVSVEGTSILKGVAIAAVEYRRLDIGVCFGNCEVQIRLVRVQNLLSCRSLTEDLEKLIDDGYLYSSKSETWPGCLYFYMFPKWLAEARGL